MSDIIQTAPALHRSVALEVNSIKEAASNSIPLRRLWRAAIVLLGIAVGAVAWTIWQLRSDAIQSAIDDSGNIAAVLSGQLSQSIESIDAVLLDIKRNSKNLDIGDRSKFRTTYDRANIYDALRKRLTQLPHVYNITIADDGGRIVVTAAKWPTPNIDAADRDYFKRAHIDADDRLIVSIPIKSRINGSSAIILARRIDRPDGKFAGIVFVSVNSDYFAKIYGSTNSVRSLIFTLVRQDGSILFRHPGTVDFTGKKLSHAVTWRNALASGAKGFRVRAKSDGKVRYVSVRQVAGYPLYVNISVTEGAALAAWYRRSIIIGLGSAILLLCSLYLLIAITKQVRQLSKSKAVLQESKQIIRAILNSIPARVFWKDRNLVYRGCNTPFAQDAGFSHAEDIIGKDDYQMGWREQADRYRDDDRQVIETGCAKLLIDEPQTTPDGTAITLLTSKVPLRKAGGEVFGVLGTYLDVTERKRLEDQLSFSNLLKTTAIDNSPDAVLVVDENGRIISRNTRFTRLWNVSAELMEKADDEPIWQAIAVQVTDAQAFIARIRDLFQHPNERAHDELKLRDGRVIDRHTAPLHGEQQKYLGRIWYFRDITELKQANERIEKQNIQLDAALNNMMQGLLMCDRTGRLIMSNRRFAEMFGVDWEKWERAASGLTVPQCMQLVRDLSNVGMKNQAEILSELRHILNQKKAGKISFERTDGHVFSSLCASIADGGFVITFEDITDQRRIEEQISHMAHYDALTDLPNRVLFYEKMGELLAHRPQNGLFAVISLDLDHFKNVNDTLGHPIGDKLLQAVAGRMLGCLRETDVVARLGGDEFAVLQTTFEQPQDATSLATRLIESVSAPYQLDGHQVVIGTSAGIAIAPGDGTAPDQLVKNADLALYRSKIDGGNKYRFFEAQMDARMQARRSLELELRKAVVNGEFSLNFQPIVNLQTGRVATCEGLIRWNHPERGEVPPMDFIPIAEETGLIVPIGRWVLEHACAEAMQWPDEITVAVNVSPVQFRAADFVNVVANALAKAGLPARRLELEITELVLMHDNASALDLLNQLKNLGVSIAMDDFGTGYSSLGYLRSFPFDRIKIDQSFIHDLSKSMQSMAILRAVVGLGSSLNIVTTAEGVETQNQLEILRSEGCTDVQGYLFSPPKPAAEVRELLRSLSGQATAAA